MKRLQSFLTLLVLLLVSVGTTWAATLEVGPGKTYSTIQAAVTAASGGDIIEVYEKANVPPFDTYKENVNIPGGKNGLIIKAIGDSVILDGATVANPKVAFRIASDNVTIQGFKIKNYNYGGATNVAYGQAQRGIGIEAINASSQHTFTNNTITDCNWGIYVREGNNITVDGNIIKKFVATSFVGTWDQQGGVGIAFISNGIAMDGNVINNNGLDNDGSAGTATYGIVYGRISGGNTGADFVEITNNSVNNDNTTGFFAYGIFNIKSGESVDFSDNASVNCYSALDIVSSIGNDNDDVTITNNDFTFTDSEVEVRASAFFTGERLWEVMVTNANTFSDDSDPLNEDLSNAIASLYFNGDSITSDGTHRFILNDLDAGITEAEEYIVANSPIDGRVYVTNGTYVSNAGASAIVDAVLGVNKLKIQGESYNAIITNGPLWAGTILDIQAGDVEVDPLTFQADLSVADVIAINTSSPSTEVHHVAFTSINDASNSYKGIVVNDAATAVDINNNSFSGAMLYAVEYESTGGTIECNDINGDVLVGSSAAIYVHDIDGGLEAMSATIISNTFAGNFANSIEVSTNVATATGAIVIGQNNLGNIFTTLLATNAIKVTQVGPNPNQVSINYNKFDNDLDNNDPNVAFATIINNNGLALNAGFNYWDVSAPNYAANVALMISGANVSWLPIYTDGTDQDLVTCGFQPLLTSLWTPVYTAEVLNDPITDADNKFFLTIADALNDGETDNTDPDPNLFVYVYLDQTTDAYTYGETALLTFQTDDILLSSAPAQPAKLVEPNPLVTRTTAGPIVDVNNDNITINNLEFDHTAGNTYQIYVSNPTQDALTITNCEFDGTAVNAIDFVAGVTTNTTINDNLFVIGNGFYGIDFDVTAANTNTTVEIDGNTFNCADNTTTAIRFGSVNTLDLTDNTFEAGIAFTAGTANTTLVNIYGNTFLPTASSVPTAIDFYHDGIVVGIYDDVNIEQNKIHQFGIGVNVNVGIGAFSARVGNFANWTINENYFANIGNDGIDLNGLTGATLDATNNHWQSNYGPAAYANAPIWHDDAGTPIIANSYGKLYNDYSGTNIVPLQDATFINFAPWWNDILGAPATYTGTSFAPIENNEATPEYFASLIFAIHATATTFDIYMQDVPDWVTPGQTVYYVESNTIQNAGKSLDIWGQPFWYPTTKITTVGNDVPDDMFLIENGTFNINFLEFVYDAGSSEDFESAIEYGLNGIGTIDWCSFNGIDGSGAALWVAYASNNTSVLTITNSRFLNNTHDDDIENVVADNGATLIIDNTTITGGNGLGLTVTGYETGISVYDGSDLTLSNSTITNMNSGALFNEAIYFSSNVAVGNIEIYQNIISNNQYGLWIGDNQAGDNYSSADIYNNIIKNNSVLGLVYEPNVASTLTVENNYWGSDNGPASEAQLGGTQENTYNETAQGNGVDDANVNSTIDFHPWRRVVTGDDLATMISGPKFAPIVRTNAANIAQGLYSSFNDAEFALLPNQKIYAYAGTYSEHVAIDVADVQYIGKLAPATYSAGWIIAPNAPQFVNAWTNGTQGANVAAPTIISGGAAQPLLADDVANFDNVSFKGFIFNTQPTTAPYVGNPTEAVHFNLNTDDITFSYNTFLADAGDKAIVWGNGQHDNWDVTYNKYDAAAAGYFVWFDAQTINTDMLINNNDLNYGAIYINKDGAGTITNFDITYNEFTNTTGAITLDGTAGGGAQVITNLNVLNNIFESSNTYAFLVDAAADNAIVNGSDWTTEVEVTNNLIAIGPTAQIVVGFANATPLVTYSNEITATCNWWGSAFGPTYSLNPGGNGGLVSDGVFFAPWLNNAGNSATFGFTPTGSCSVGERVWVNADANPATKTIVFPSLQWAVQHTTVVNGPNVHIFVSDAYNNVTNDAGTSYVQEDITINWATTADRTLYAQTPANELKINGDFQLAGTVAYDLLLGSNLRIMDNLTLDNIGATGQFILGEKNLTVQDNITDASYGAVVTNNSGYLIKENVETGGINRFPVTYTESNTATPAEFVVNASGFTTAQNNILKVRVNNADPVTTKGMGENGYDVNNIWSIDWTNNNSGTDPNMAMTLRFLNDALNDANFTLNKTISYAAYWDMAPLATQWTTRKSTSSWNGSDGVQVTNLNLETGASDWSLFYGSTSFALSTPPTQAKNIQWIGGDDRNLQFQWQRNGANNQYYAIMAVKGSMTAWPTDAFNPIGTGAGTSSPWVASATSRNFSDGYVDNVSSLSWTSSLFHNLAATPADVKVLKVGKYDTLDLTETALVTNLDQGTYYTFFVANFNYGDGTTAISAMETGADGMANYELEDNTLNPRTRKTQPAVYMTLDLSSTFSNDVTNQPNIVYGTSLTNPTDSTDISLSDNWWRVNGDLQDQAVVRNQYNNDSLAGGNYAQVCEPDAFTANNLLLYFKGYGNNGGSNWGIKYSENNSTYTFTTPLVYSNTSRTRDVRTKYYLVSAYDGDGKVAALYDNNQNLQFVIDTTTKVDASIDPLSTHPTCEGNSVNFLSQPSSYPNANFVEWQVYNTNTMAWEEAVTGTNVVSTITASGDDITLSNLDYADNGKRFRAAYSATSVCDYPNLGATHYTDTLTLLIYDATLTGTNPAVGTDDTPYICSDVATITFASDDNGPLTPPNALTLQGWYIYDGAWSGLITAAGTYNDITINGVTGVGTNSGTIEIDSTNMALLDGIQVKAEWKNGNCAVTETTPTTLNIVDKPVITPLVPPAGVCINQDIDIASVSTAANAGATQTIQWQYSTDGITYSNLVDGTTADVTVAGATTTDVTITPHTLVWDEYYVKVIYKHSEGGTDCADTSNAVQIDVLPTPVFDPIADQTVCEDTQLQISAVDAGPDSWSGNIEWYYNSTPTMAGATQMNTGNIYKNSTVTIGGNSDSTITISNIDVLWNDVYVLAYNDNGACSDFVAFKVVIDTLPVISNEDVTPNPACAYTDNVTYSIDFTTNANTVQWYYNGNLVTDGNSVAGGATQNVAAITTSFGTSSLTLSNTSTIINGVNVFARVTNGTCGFVQSANMTVAIDSIPVVPATVGAQDIFSHRFNVTWTGVVNATDYDVQVSSLADFSVLDTSVNITAPAVTWTGMDNCLLDPAKTYYFRVRANNDCGEGAWKTSNIVTLDPTVTSIAYAAGDDGAFGNVLVGNSSTPDEIVITYYQLDAGLEMSVPAGYQISINGGANWLPFNNAIDSTVDLTPALTLYLGTPGSLLRDTVLVRFTPSTCGSATGDLAITTLETCTGVTAMPTPDFVSVSGTGVVSAPTAEATNGIVMENTANEFTATWTDGNGTDRLVVISLTETLTWTPTDNMGYTTGSSNITTATELETGNAWLVGVTPSQPLTITGLTAGVNYFVHVWEYNKCGTATEQYDDAYYTFQPYYLAFGPINDPQTSGAESEDIDMLLTQRNGDPIANPFANLTVNVTNSEGDTGLDFILDPSPVVIANGDASTTFTFNWSNTCGVEDGYLMATATNVMPAESNTFDLEITTPTQQARILVWVGTPCASSTVIKWTNGNNNTGRILVAREGALPVAPTDGQSYTPNKDWATKDANNNIGSDSYVMSALFTSDPVNNQDTITNLDLGSTYYFRVYEFNGCDLSMRKYITTNATFNPRSRTINCKEGNDLGDIVLDRFSATSNNGIGKLNFNTLYEANISGFELRRINLTDEEMGGILVGSYMSNTELVAEGNTMTGKAYSFTDNSALLEVGKSYLYQLTAIAFDGTRIDVAETELTINDDIYTGISEFSVSPVVVNNTEARFDLTVDKAQNVTITMYDVTGQKVASIANDIRINRGTQQFSTNIQNVTNGTYMIVVEAADGVSAVQKFQIVR